MKDLPTLSSIGWADDILTKGKKIFQYFINTYYSDSTIYFGNITSLKWIMNNDEKDTVEELRKNLEILYLNYFDDVEVNISTKKEGNFVDVFINIVVIEKNKRHEIFKGSVYTDEYETDTVFKKELEGE